MTIKDIQKLLGADNVSGEGDLDHEITSGFVGDLLSVVMGKAKEGCAWMTIQSHMNIVAVGTLVDVGCIIVTEGFKVDDSALKKATSEEIVILSTTLSSYEAASILAKAGL